MMCHSNSRNRVDEAVQSGGNSDSNDSLADWVNAEALLIKELFQRQIQADLSLMLSQNDLEEARHAEAVCMTHDEFAVRLHLYTSAFYQRKLIHCGVTEVCAAYPEASCVILSLSLTVAHKMCARLRSLQGDQHCRVTAGVDV